MRFAPDPRYTEVAVAYAADAVDFARNAFKKQLDYSDASIAVVEEILSSLHLDAVRTNPSEEKIYQLAKMFGSYTGEVFRRNYGAEWGIVTHGEQSMPGLRAMQKGNLFWPWGKANGRIVNGPEDNLLYYYHVLTEGLSPLAPEPSQIIPEQNAPIVTQSEFVEAKKSWLKRLFRA